VIVDKLPDLIGILHCALVFRLGFSVGGGPRGRKPGDRPTPDAELVHGCARYRREETAWHCPRSIRGGRTPSALIEGDDAKTIAVEVAKQARLQPGSGSIMRGNDIDRQ
jgi:hypothetical protein